jgi:hypothetical protein
MFRMPTDQERTREFQSFAAQMRRLGETFVVRDVMVDVAKVIYVHPGDIKGARDIVRRERFSVVPASECGTVFERVFCTEPQPGDEISVIPERPVSISDHIPDSTPVADAFSLFDEREWYLTFRGNKVSGLITYWELNRHEFRVQLYPMLSLIEELSRHILVAAGCGVSDCTGIELDAGDLKRAQQRFSSAKADGGGNNFVDHLDFHHLNKALWKCDWWREFLGRRGISRTQYEKEYNFNPIRNEVMHGRVLFPTYQQFTNRRTAIAKMADWIDLLYAYRAVQNSHPFAARGF